MMWGWPNLISAAAADARRCAMKWAGMYFVGFVILIGGILAALWKLGILQHIETTWILIGIAILVGIGIMVSVANSGAKENIQIDRK
jgi:drug/metabolite transporter (DMT)-like permease